jgi:NAD(P)-dependent dehydrogenase (short-subunit alcohol dehydrogenase family)
MQKYLHESMRSDTPQLCTFDGSSVMLAKAATGSNRDRRPWGQIAYRQQTEIDNTRSPTVGARRHMGLQAADLATTGEHVPTPNSYPSPSELYSLVGEVAVVTGGGRGIGEGIARTLASAGAKVVVAARRGDEVESVAAQIRADGGQAIGVVTDVTDDAAVDALAQVALREFGKLSIWVNNAGGSPARLPMTELKRADWDACLALNLTAVWIGIVTAAKYMDNGSIINVSSGAGTGPVPGSGHYGAAKAGVNSLTQTASAELAPRIRVNGIAPGAVPTEIFKKALSIETDEDLAVAEAHWNIPMGRFGTPLDMGSAVLFLCSPGASWITGETVRVGGGAKPR